jgi:hypothetical protein
VIVQGRIVRVMIAPVRVVPVVIVRVVMIEGDRVVPVVIVQGQIVRVMIAPVRVVPVVIVRVVMIGRDRAVPVVIVLGRIVRVMIALVARNVKVEVGRSDRIRMGTHHVSAVMKIHVNQEDRGFRKKYSLRIWISQFGSSCKHCLNPCRNVLVGIY